jgi:hypothetical protein
MNAMAMRTKIQAYYYVPAGSIIRPGSGIWGLRIVSHKKYRYMKNVLKAANQLREEYFKSRAVMKTG